MFMTQAQIASQIGRIGPLLTHSLMVNAKLSLSLLFIVSQILEVFISAHLNDAILLSEYVGSIVLLLILTC